MFRVLIKLAIAALLINAAWQVGSTFLRYYQYEDALQEIAQFGEHRTDRQLCSQAVDKAGTMDVPLTASAISIRRGNNAPLNCQTGYEGAAPTAYAASTSAKIYIDASYHEDLAVVPGYRYPWDFKVSVSAWIRP